MALLVNFPKLLRMYTAPGYIHTFLITALTRYGKSAVIFMRHQETKEIERRQDDFLGGGSSSETLKYSVVWGMASHWLLGLVAET